MNRLLVIIAVLLGLSACGTAKKVGEMENQNSVLVYGYAYDADGPLDFGWIQLRQNIAGEDMYVTINTDGEGLFYGENLPLGKYQINRFGWGGVPVGETGVFGVASNSLILKKEGNQTAVHAKNPGVMFMGAFRYTFTSTGLFSPGKRSFDKAATPAEKEVLEKLLEHTTGTRWEARVKKRLAELK